MSSFVKFSGLVFGSLLPAPLKRRPVFKWAAVVAFIEQGPPTERVPHYREQLSLWDESAKSAAKPVRSK